MADHHILWVRKMSEQLHSNLMGPEQRLLAENERLRAHLADLQTRLKEPEEIIRAIRHGEVDAFVVTEPLHGERIYSLKSADALYRVMVEDMREGAVAMDSAGIVLYCNRHFARMIKAGRETIVGRPLFPFVLDESRSYFDVLTQPSVDRTVRSQLLLRASDGTTVPVYAAMNRILVEENEAFCLIVTDLTEQKRREELLAEARRKDNFLAMLAHELRNPIAPIQNALEILRLKEKADPDLEWARGVVERQVQQLSRLVDDLLDIARISQDKMKLQLEAVDLKTIVARAAELSHPVIDARHHELTIELPPGTMPVWADVTRLTQVISNLLNNASKFTPEHGRIWLTVRQHDDEAIICLRDTGVGIPAAMLPKIFDLFTQVDETIERAQGGLGIGLTLVRNLVELHGGTVSVSSPGPGEGSEFTVRLPLLKEIPDQTHPPFHGPGKRQKSAAPSACRVLVVDDNRDAVETLVRVLALWGHDARMATDAAAALDQAREFHPDVILMDISMPGVSGYDLARQIRKIEGLESVVLVALTGYGLEEDRRKSQEAGFDHHWVKPADPVALEQLLNSVARARHARGS